MCHILTQRAFTDYTLTLGPPPPRLVESGRSALFTFSAALREKSGDRDRNGCWQQQTAGILAGDLSCASKTQKWVYSFEIYPTCGDKAALGERRVT